MKIDWREYEEKNHVMAWFLVEAMGHAGVEKFSDFDSSELEVELKINGIDTPIKPVMDFLQGQLSSIENSGRMQGMEDAAYIISQNIEKILQIEEK